MFKLMRAVSVTAMIAAALSACTTSSTPLYNISQLSPVNGSPTYRVTCYGLLESTQTCEAAAQNLCGSSFTKVNQLAPLGNVNSDGKPNAREFAFMCGVPKPVAPPVAPRAPIAMPAPAPVVKAAPLAAAVYFQTGKSSLTTDAKDELDILASRTHDPVRVMRIDSYTDASGSAQLNQSLSAGRARAVAQYLKSHGVQADSVDIESHGPADPKANNGTADGRAQNRRVDVLLQQ